MEDGAVQRGADGDAAEKTTAAQNRQPIERPVSTPPGSKISDIGMSTAAEASPTQAWNCNGLTPSICFISTEPSEPSTTETSTKARPPVRVKPCGSHITARAPIRVRLMPSKRRRFSLSPSSMKDRKVVVGTISWLTIAADEGLAVFSAMNMNANEPAPMHTAISSRRHRGRGGLRSQGNTAAATMMKRTAA